MNGCMAHPIRWKVAREEGGFCPYCELAEQRSKLSACSKANEDLAEQIRLRDAEIDQWRAHAAERVDTFERERSSLASRLHSLSEAVIDAWRSNREGDMWKALGRAMDIVDPTRSVVEKHERICGVPDPDDECEECIRPLGHDGEHDFSTPPE